MLETRLVSRRACYCSDNLTGARRKVVEAMPSHIQSALKQDDIEPLVAQIPRR